MPFLQASLIKRLALLRTSQHKLWERLNIGWTLRELTMLICLRGQTPIGANWELLTSVDGTWGDTPVYLMVYRWTGDIEGLDAGINSYVGGWASAGLFMWNYPN